MATLEVPNLDLAIRRRPITAHSLDSSTYSLTSPKAIDKQDSSHSSDLTQRPKTAPATSEEPNIVRNLEKQNSNFRSARYLALQWRSRSAQWSVTSAMHSSKTSSSLVSSPPPPLKEYDSDSESSYDNASADESVVSQVSEAYKVLETWKSRSASLSVGNRSSSHSDSDEEEEDVDDNDHDHDDVDDMTGDQDMGNKDPKNSKESNLDEFEMPKDPFTFAFARKGNTQEMKSISLTSKHVSISQHGPPKDHHSVNVRNIPSVSTMQPQKRNENQPTNPSNHPDDHEEEVLRHLYSTPDPSKPSTYKKILQTQLELAKSRVTLQQHQVNNTKTNTLQNQTMPSKLKSTSTLNNNNNSSSSSSSNNNNNNNKNNIQRMSHHAHNPNPSSSINEKETTNKITWDVFHFVFTFSLLTNLQKAPPTGDYVPDDKCPAFKDKLKFKSKLLYDILQHFSTMLAKLPSASKERNGKKFMMLSPDCIPSLKYVRRDYSYKPPVDRNDTVRSFVRISVAIFVPRNNLPAREDAKSVVRQTFATAIRTGKFDGF
eukprot:CAMPEP_0176491798 /NCGR_PEP_ID=MMETSP0200_2-20121128/8628_1 /TAXON_ID=947934 /ORGANISM="Chaetoceros sp., Strain GSL56" /LENGTH=542 /DNA_ID=CAMNT_0017889259 /DNA_START=86 /DNA_END=1714 /DNA_ORIENTATION=+